MWINPFLLVLSMDWTSLLAGSDALSSLAQYPDRRLYNAAAMLSPEDRPSVPVRITDNPAVQFERYRNYPNKELPEAFVIPDKLNEIYVNSRKPMLNNKYRLAASLGHEQVHIRGGDELAARRREVEILRQLGGEQKYADLIRQRYNLK